MELYLCSQITNTISHEQQDEKMINISDYENTIKMLEHFLALLENNWDIIQRKHIFNERTTEITCFCVGEKCVINYFKFSINLLLTFLKDNLDKQFIRYINSCISHDEKTNIFKIDLSKTNKRFIEETQKIIVSYDNGKFYNAIQIKFHLNETRSLRIDGYSSKPREIIDNNIMKNNLRPYLTHIIMDLYNTTRIKNDILKLTDKKIAKSIDKFYPNNRSRFIQAIKKIFKN